MQTSSLFYAFFDSQALQYQYSQSYWQWCSVLMCNYKFLASTNNCIVHCPLFKLCIMRLVIASYAWLRWWLSSAKLVCHFCAAFTTRWSWNSNFERFFFQTNNACYSDVLKQKKLYLLLSKSHQSSCDCYWHLCTGDFQELKINWVWKGWSDHCWSFARGQDQELKC